MVCAMLPCEMAAGSERSAALSCDYTVSSSPSTSEGGSSCSSPLSIERTLLHRLYVVGIPDGCTETSLHGLFAQHGSVRDLAIMYDKANGQCSGYAFVSFATRQEADSAIAELDDRMTLPGSHTPLRVRYAKNAYGIPLGAGPADNTKLHFSRVPRGVSRDAVVGLFASFDTVVSIEIFRGKNGCSMGLTSGLVTLASHAGAAAARRALDGHVMEGGCAPLKVQWSDPDMQHKKRRAQQAAEGRTLFFSRALTTATKAEIQAVFNQYGQVLEVVPFLVSKGSTFTRGCGLVMMGSQQEATAAIEALNGNYTWAGKDRPMVVVPLDMTLQDRRRNSTGTTVGPGQKLRADSMPFAAQMAMADALSSMDLDPSLALQMHPSLLLRTALSTPPASGMTSSFPSSSLVADPPPVGCDRDAYKLFVGNVPKACTEEHLRPLFEPYGKVVELVVTRDKQTKASKGSAFVWYSTKMQATTAAAALNKKPLDPSNPESASLVVRRANPRQVSLPSGQQGVSRAGRLSVDGAGMNGLASSFGQLGLGGSGGPGSLTWLGGGMDVGQGQDIYATQQASSHMSMDQAWALQAGHSPLNDPYSHNLRSLRSCPSAPAASLASMASSHNDALLMGSHQPPVDFYSMLDAPGQHGGHAATANAGGGSSGFSYLSGRTLSNPHDGSMTWHAPPMASSLHPAASAPLPSQEPVATADGLVALSLHLSLQQVGEAARHIHDVQSLTGAQLTMSTGPMGDFTLLLTGQKERVLQARALLSSMLGQMGTAHSNGLDSTAGQPLQQQWQHHQQQQRHHQNIGREQQLPGGFSAPEHLAHMVRTA